MSEQRTEQPHDIHPFSAPLWELGISEVRSHNLESSGREEVNQLLSEGWLLLHIYTLRYHDDADGGAWRDRPMAILGKPAFSAPQN